MSDQVRRSLLRPTLEPLPNNQSRSESHCNWLPAAFGLLIVGGWYLLTRNNTRGFAIASPEDVVSAFVKTLSNGTLIRDLAVTLLEIGIGFSIGVLIAFMLGYGIAHSRLMERTIGPFAVGFQAVPIIAIAPVLIIVAGPGILTNGLICALIVFFPMLVTTIVGLRTVDPDLRDLMRVLRATRWQTFTRLELPGALPVLLGGLKISTTLAVIGAVIGESVSSQAGLGYMIYSARYQYQPGLTLVGVFTLTALALALYQLLTGLERRLLRWQRADG